MCASAPSPVSILRKCFSFGIDWDPEGTIRAGIKSDLAMISSGKICSGLSTEEDFSAVIRLTENLARLDSHRM
jgi:hypothetical protein